jgi:signal transduction histidine kinase
MMGAVDGELNRSISSAETLASTDSLDRNDLVRFRQEAQRVLGVRPLWQTIILSEPSGRQLVNLARPLGSPLPTRSIDEEGLHAVLQTRRPTVAGIFVGPTTRTPGFGVRVPVIRDGEVRYVLTVVVKPQAMVEVIERQGVPTNGLVTIFDDRNNVVARSRAQGKFVGQPVSATLAHLIRGGREGWGVITTADGESVYAVYSLSEFSHWGVAIGVPARTIDAAVLHSYLFLVAGVALSLAIGVIAALLVARRITRPIQELRRAALAVGRGQQPAVFPTPIPEIRDVADALALAADDRRRAEMVREEVLLREREARAVAEDANRMKDEFLAMLGHELRNPLAAISNAVRVLELRAGADKSADAAHVILRRQVEHLTHLVNDLLDVERVMTGKILLERAPLELSAAAEHSIAALRAAGRLELHEIVLHTEPVWIDADATRIDQVVANLVTNAVKYTPPGKGVSIDVRLEGSNAVLRVRDQGIGMDRDLLPRIFDLFVQGHRSIDRSQGGLGIGLTLVRQLVELHGGKVIAESEGPGKGSTFTARLPAIGAPEFVPDARAPAKPAAPRTVLIVEDNQDARTTLRQLLESAGHRVHEAADGMQGLEVALRVAPDVAVIDIGLPGLDGFELARRIRSSALGQSVRLVALTGYGSPEDRRRATEAGFDVHLVKPMSGETIERVLAEL